MSHITRNPLLCIVIDIQADRAASRVPRTVVVCVPSPIRLSQFFPRRCVVIADFIEHFGIEVKLHKSAGEVAIYYNPFFFQ